MERKYIYPPLSPSTTVAGASGNAREMQNVEVEGGNPLLAMSKEKVGELRRSAPPMPAAPEVHDGPVSRPDLESLEASTLAIDMAALGVSRAGVAAEESLSADDSELEHCSDDSELELCVLCGDTHLPYLNCQEWSASARANLARANAYVAEVAATTPSLPLEDELLSHYKEQVRREILFISWYCMTEYLSIIMTYNFMLCLLFSPADRSRRGPASSC